MLKLNLAGAVGRRDGILCVDDLRRHVEILKYTRKKRHRADPLDLNV